MSTTPTPDPARYTLRDLPLPAKLVVTTFLISVGLGYLWAMAQIHFKHASAGEPMPTPGRPGGPVLRRPVAARAQAGPPATRRKRRTWPRASGRDSGSRSPARQDQDAHRQPVRRVPLARAARRTTVAAGQVRRDRQVPGPRRPTTRRGNCHTVSPGTAKEVGQEEHGQGVLREVRGLGRPDESRDERQSVGAAPRGRTAGRWSPGSRPAPRRPSTTRTPFRCRPDFKFKDLPPEFGRQPPPSLPAGRRSRTNEAGRQVEGGQATAAVGRTP